MAVQNFTKTCKLLLILQHISVSLFVVPHSLSVKGTQSVLLTAELAVPLRVSGVVGIVSAAVVNREKSMFWTTELTVSRTVSGVECVEGTAAVNGVASVLLTAELAVPLTVSGVEGMESAAVVNRARGATE